MFSSLSRNSECRSRWFVFALLTFSSLAGTRLIFVVGQTGSGKTTLLGEITSQELKVGHSATSGRIAHLTIALDDIC